MALSKTHTKIPAMSEQAAAAIPSALRTLEAEASGVTALAAALQSDLGACFASTIDLIQSAKGRLIITGLGKSGHIGRKIAATFASTGTPAFFVHASEASHGDLGMITADDIILALSWSGEQPEMKNLISYAKRFKIALVAMTSDPTSTLASAADVSLTLPKAREACPHNLAPTTSSLMMLALGDALAIALLESRGFTPGDFSVLHPGGKLGAMLKYARDLMHTGEAVPLKPLGTRMSDALVEMSAKGFGCVGIIDANGQIAGIVTDGDLRRNMRPDLMTATVDEVMTRNPKTISPNMLAGQALELLNSSKITALLVAEGRRPLGIVHLHDLLRAGVA
ncbi:arabinose-5-phosphate isomerase [Rhodopseudomonas thermotolerans]|uniref:Arabinose-5-phosphate isomerase n=2 Tax=Rhodopseudomonas TaxID=1073 RepID=A0A336JYQ0_9BRAD|nr:MULTISPECIES: KpsF/GutQ family sugar-phosphate isomerase [Rhodopseudomonas]RED27659.1 arabinose-5-phosphate isomerase [Rhodopseudomonas pentothenatexigens]REF91194.1 arabinose-5-phosphate isomerase [Rhodopseudomonas thermotolerans]SSW92804.1 arabinose-5-phosphate isomerase [Rhodopseudomonas pentothenatexigens]